LPLLRHIQTPYGPVSVVRDARTGEVLYKQGGARQSESDGLGVSTSAYIHAIYGLIVQRPAKRVLTIGCGAGVLATMLARHGAQVTVVDINPASFEIARQYFSLDQRVTCVVDDGVRFLKNSATVFDAMVLDAYQGNELPAPFLTSAFARLARARLDHRRGRFFANMFLPWADHPAAGNLAKTLARAFGAVRILDEVSGAHRNCIVMAGAVSRLAVPTMTMPPACAAGKVFQDLAGFEFAAPQPEQRAAARKQAIR
jgi:spermidine synthase